MARRIIRDHKALDGESATDVVNRLRDEMSHYLERARFPYLNADRHKVSSDLILSGCCSLQELTNQVLEHVRGQRNKTDLSLP